MRLPLAAFHGSALSARPRLSILSSRFWKPVLAMIILALSLARVTAQELAQDDVIRVSTDLVVVPTIVSDSRGHPVFALKQEDFVVRDNGEITTLQHFSVGTQKVALAFLLDASGSAREYAQKQSEAALALFSRFGPGSQVAVLHFTEQAKVAVPFTSEIEKARGGFQFPSIAERHTAIFDSAAAAIQLFAQGLKSGTERRIVILTSDGLDTVSKTRATDVIEHARALGISFYVIQFPLFIPRDGHLTARPSSKGFRELAEKTGGQYFVAGDVRSALDPNAQYDLSAVFQAIAQDLASQYLLGFYPDKTTGNGRRHTIEVTLTNNPRKYRVRTLRQEYNLAP